MSLDAEANVRTAFHVAGTVMDGRDGRVKTRGLSAETSHWRDTGCDLHAECLTCPLPQCRYEMASSRASTIVRAMRISERIATGLTVEQVATEMGVSRRTAHRLTGRWK